MNVPDLSPSVAGFGPAVVTGGSRLMRQAHQRRATLSVTAGMALARGRVHELCGRARQTLALAVAGACGSGTVVWILPGWTQERLNGEGITQWIDPGRLLLVQPDRVDDVLWAMEEALRAGVAPIVVAEVPDPPALTPVRRLHLAAEAGCGRGLCKPIGLILTPGEGGAAGIESRWRLDAQHDAPVSMTWQLSCLRDRMAPSCTEPAYGARSAERRLMLQTRTSLASV